MARFESPRLRRIDGDLHEGPTGHEFRYSLRRHSAYHVPVNHDSHAGKTFETPECEGDIQPDFVAPVISEAEDDMVPAANKGDYDHDDVCYEEDLVLEAADW